jgi:integrase
LWRWEFEHQKRRYTGCGYKTKAGAREAREKKRQEVKKPIPADMGFRELASRYLDYAERRFAIKTYKYKAGVFRNFLSFCDQDLSVDQISIPLIESYLQTRHSNVNYNRHRKDLCALFSWAWKRRLMSENPCFFLEKLPEPKFHRAIPSVEEMAKIILAAGEHRPLLLVLYHTLARIDEALRLKWTDINFTEKTLTLYTRKGRSGEWKGDSLFMNRALYDTLWNLWGKREQDTWVFYNQATGSRYNRRPKLMRSICSRAGVPAYGFHAIRHYVASRLYDEKKWSMAKVSKILRHTSKQTTEIYLQVQDPEMMRVMESLEADF